MAFLKLDVQYADEDEQFAANSAFPRARSIRASCVPTTATSWSWATPCTGPRKTDCDVLLVETAGLCLRCSPYVDGGLGMVVLEATSGMNLPLKVGPMLSLADIAVVTKIDRVSQAEREVFRARIQDVAPRVRIREVNALHGIGIDPLVDEILADAAKSRSRCSCAAIRRWAPARSAWARRRSAGSRISAWCAPLENQTFYRGE